jgi:hypothetical protein
MQSAKLKVKLKSSAHKNKTLSATLPANGARKVLDNPQSRDHCSTSQCGSMGIDPHEQEGKL